MQASANLLIALLLLTLCVFAFFEFQRNRTPGSWEYAIIAPIDAEFEKQMSEAGDAGWEVVTCRRAQVGPGLDDTRFTYECIMKRHRVP